MAERKTMGGQVTRIRRSERSASPEAKLRNAVRGSRARLGVMGGAMTYDVTLGQVLMLHEVFLTPGVGIKELAERMGTAHTTVTRFADVFGTHGRGGRKGWGLVERRPDPEDRRMQRLYVTAEGRALLKRVAQNLPTGDGW